MTRLTLVDYNEEFEKSKVISSPDSIDKSDNTFANDGIFSEEIFGKEKDPENIDNIGWVDFGETYIINPIMYERVGRLFKQSKFIDMISYDKKVTSSGKILDLTEEELLTSTDFEDKNIGLYEFRMNFLSLLDKHILPKFRGSETHRVVLHAYFTNKLFINKFPVYSPKLRPAQIFSSEKVFKFSEINNSYNFVVTHSNTIKDIMSDSVYDESKLQILNLNFQLQMDCYNVVRAIINDDLKGKRGTFRKIIMGTRINHSARNVIIPSPNNKMDEVSMNYKTFAILYKISLINLISKSKKITVNKAKRFVNKNTNRFNQELYDYMTELITKTKHGMYIILNRNPSISISSILLCRIKEVKPDIHDVTLSISNNILAGLGADFDGDGARR